jgi:hypothetical protein
VLSSRGIELCCDVGESLVEDSKSVLSIERALVLELLLGEWQRLMFRMGLFLSVLDILVSLAPDAGLLFSVVFVTEEGDLMCLSEIHKAFVCSLLIEVFVCDFVVLLVVPVLLQCNDDDPDNPEVDGSFLILVMNGLLQSECIVLG